MCAGRCQVAGRRKGRHGGPKSRTPHPLLCICTAARTFALFHVCAVAQARLSCATCALRGGPSARKPLPPSSLLWIRRRSHEKNHTPYIRVSTLMYLFFSWVSAGETRKKRGSLSMRDTPVRPRSPARWRQPGAGPSPRRLRRMYVGRVQHREADKVAPSPPPSGQADRAGFIDPSQNHNHDQTPHPGQLQKTPTLQTTAPPAPPPSGSLYLVGNPGRAFLPQTQGGGHESEHLIHITVTDPATAVPENTRGGIYGI